MYHKSHGYQLRGGSLCFGPVPNLVRKFQHDLPSRAMVPIRLDPDTALPPPKTPVSWEKRNGAISTDTCGDSAKKVLKFATLITLEEAQRREISRRNRAADRSLEKKEFRIEREVSRLKLEVAEIAWKKAQAKREEEAIARSEKETPERKREEGSTLTAAVAAREDGLVVAPTDWIVPLISLDEARQTEKAKRDAAESKPLVHMPSPPTSAVTFINSLTVNSGNGNTAKLQLISLEEARGRERTRRLEEDAVFRTRMHTQAGAGLSHVSLITLAEARKQDAVRRSRISHDRYKPKRSRSMSRSRKPSSSAVDQVIETRSGDRLALAKDASAPEEKARLVGLTSDAESWWTRPNAIPAYRAYTAEGYHP